jgi:hypothetical protein
MSRPKSQATLDRENEILELRKQLEEQSKKIDALLKMQGVPSVNQPVESPKSAELEDDGEIVIGADAYIKVMSLTPHRLTLTTQPKGRGKQFNFDSFGEVKRLQFRDLVDCIETNRHLMEDGNYIILNKKVITKLGLDDIYATILTKDVMEKIMFGNNESDAVKLYAIANEVQRDAIDRLLIDRMLNGEKVDLNLLNSLSRITNPSEDDSIPSLYQRYKTMKTLRDSKDK